MGFGETAVRIDEQILVDSLKAQRKYTYIPFSLHIFDSLSSTNQTAWELVNQGAEPGTVVIAREQTAGRGQWGREWVSPTGGLYLSVAIKPQLKATDSYQLTLATAWGIAAELRKAGVNVGIKWPNDLVLNSRKLGGILTETKVNQGQINQAVIGVGINWSNPVPETGINLESWQTVQNSWSISSISMLTSKVLLGIDSGIECLYQEGINILLSRYLDLLTNIGDEVYVNNFLGTVVGVTSQGSLRLKKATYDTKESPFCEVPQVGEKPRPDFVLTPEEIFIQPGTISLGYCRSPV